MDAGYYDSIEISADISGVIDLTPTPTNPWDGHIVPIATNATAAQTYYLSSLCREDIWRNITTNNFFYTVTGGQVSASSGGAPGNLARSTYVEPVITYDSSTGILSITPAILKAYEGGSNAPASNSTNLKTSVFLIK